MIDLLGVVELSATGNAGGVHVTDVVLVLTDAADHIAVHDLHVVDIEEQFHPRRVDAFDQVDAQVDIVTEVAGMPFHRVRVIARVQVFQTKGDPLLFGITNDLFPAVDAIAHSLARRRSPARGNR